MSNLTNQTRNVHKHPVTGETSNPDIAMDIERNDSFLLSPLEKKKNRKFGLSDLVKILGCDTSAKYDLQKTTSNSSAGQKQCNVARLLQYGGPKRDNGSHVLRVAAKRQYADFVELLLDVGADPNATTKHGYTALHLAIIQERTRHLQSQNSSRDVGVIERITRILLERGADVNCMTNNGFSPLHYAVNFGYSNVVSLLLKHGAEVNLVIEQFVKHAETGECFCMLDQLECVLASKQHNSTGSNGPWKDPPSTILHLAAMKKYSNIVRMLLEKGAKVDAVQYDGKTPLFVAFQENGENCEEVVHILLEHGASVNFKCLDGKTPLHYAARRNNVAGVELLIRKGAIVNSLDRHKNSPLAIAVKDGSDDVVKSLLEHGADVDPKNTDGVTPLHIACEKAKCGVVRLLLEAGASVNSTCRRGLLPYNYALNAKHQFLISRIVSTRIGSFITRDDIYEHKLTKLASTVQLLQRHINIINLLGLPLQEYNKKVSENITALDITDTDLASFKSKTVYRNVTIDYFLKSSSNDPVYVMNGKALQGLDKVVSELDEENSVFRNVLKYVVRTAKVRFDLINKAQDCLLRLVTCSGNQLPMLPEEVARNVVLLLKNEELESFIENVFKVKKNYNKCRKRKLNVGCQTIN